MILEANTQRLDKPPFVLHSDAITFDREDGVDGKLIHTFGLGGASLFLNITVDGAEIREEFKMDDFLQTWADAIVSEVRE